MGYLMAGNGKMIGDCGIKESFDLAQADEGLNSHVNIFNLYGAFSS
jgi:hypothetical protein